MQINQQMMKTKMLMTAALMMTAAAAYFGDNVACTHHEADELAKRLEEKDCNQRLTVEYLS